MINHEALDSITRHVEKLRAPTTKRGFRLVHWRAVIRLAQDEYDREIAELDALNGLKADPQFEVPVV